MRRRLELLLPAVLVVAVVILMVYLDHTSATYRSFFSWPNGSTWSNLIEQVEGIVIGVFLTWYLRDHIGKSVAAWMHRNSPERQEIHQASVDALHVVVDLYRYVTGDEHPKAPQ